MTRLLIIFVFFILHIQFLCEIVFGGITDYNFWGWHFEFTYPREVAIKALMLSVSSMFAFLLGYYIRLKNKRKSVIEYSYSDNSDKSDKLNTVIFLLKISLLFQIFTCLFIIVAGRANYSSMVDIREKINFLIELRVIPLLLLSYLSLNTELPLWKVKPYNELFKYLILYGILVVFIQARSLLFEFGIIAIYPWLRFKKDKFKLKYVFLLYLLSIVPNLLILTRINPDLVNFHDIDTYKNIFSYEYSIYFNNILGETIFSTNHFFYGKSLLTAFQLLIPSFLRESMGILIDKNMLSDISLDAGMTGGGFSLLAELYLNFGYFSILVFFVFGYLLANLNVRAFYAKHVTIMYSTAPLFYVYFVLAFRNDLGVFIKQVIQLFILAKLLDIIINRTKTIKRIKL